MSKRKPNWTDKEKVILMEEFDKRKDIIKAKFSAKVTSAMKNTAWEEIAASINCHNPSVKGDVKEVQKKWDNICAAAKTEFATNKKMQRKTGGRPSPAEVSDISQRVCEIIGEDSPTLAGIEGGVDVEDDDEFTPEENLPSVSKRPRKILSCSSRSESNSNVEELHKEVLILEKTRLNSEIEKLELEKDKLKLESEKLKIEKGKLKQEKNKLALEIAKLTMEMRNFGVDVNIEDE